MSNTWLHDPRISWINKEGSLCVDLLQLALKSGAPVTHETINRLGLMVQRVLHQLDPDLTPESNILKTPQQCGRRLVLPGYEAKHPKQIARNIHNAHPF